jgi:hypothetical protein
MACVSEILRKGFLKAVLLAALILGVGYLIHEIFLTT